MHTLVIWWSAYLVALVCFGWSTAGCNEQDRPVSSDPRARDGAGIVEGVIGYVTARDGSPIVGALVQPQALDVPRPPIPDLAVLTNSEGWYQWRLFPGTYTLVVSAQGYQSAAQVVTVHAGETARLDFTLERAP
jgi:hypothetical protein